MYIILAILAFGVLIIVHELGHFILAKLNGVRVEEFSIGMGPKILSKQGKETKYSLGIFPVGGYVKMMGEEEAVQDERSFSAKSPLRRISIIIAGVVMNYILAVIIFISFTYTHGYVKTVLSEVTPNSPAYASGLLPGDKIEKINGSRNFTSDDASFEINMSKGNPINISIDRNGEKKEINVTPTKDENNQLVIGVKFTPVESPTLGESFKQGLNQTASFVSLTYKSIGMLLTKKANVMTDVGGPITIIKMSATAAKAGFWTLAYFVGYLSVNLAVFNLLPFPALDGGWCVILLIELITRRKVPDKIVGVLNFAGFAVLIALMVLVIIKDALFPMNF